MIVLVLKRTSKKEDSKKGPFHAQIYSTLEESKRLCRSCVCKKYIFYICDAEIKCRERVQLSWRTVLLSEIFNQITL